MIWLGCSKFEAPYRGGERREQCRFNPTESPLPPPLHTVGEVPFLIFCFPFKRNDTVATAFTLVGSRRVYATAVVVASPHRAVARASGGRSIRQAVGMYSSPEIRLGGGWSQRAQYKLPTTRPVPGLLHPGLRETFSLVLPKDFTPCEMIYSRAFCVSTALHAIMFWLCTPLPLDNILGPTSCTSYDIAARWQRLRRERYGLVRLLREDCGSCTSIFHRRLHDACLRLLTRNIEATSLYIHTTT